MARRTSATPRRLAFFALVALIAAGIVVQSAPGVSSALLPVRTQASDLLVVTNGTAREPNAEPGVIAVMLPDAS